jgi:hypothetical protein
MSWYGEITKTIKVYKNKSTFIHFNYIPIRHKTFDKWKKKTFQKNF